MTQFFNLTHSSSFEANTGQQSLYNAQYGKPQRVWIDKGNIFVKGHDGAIVSMTPEVALELSRLIGAAGAESLVSKVMTQVASRAIDPTINEI
jgi:hypothetical protein